MPADPPLLIYYQEPDPDRWIPFDRYPRGLIRRIARGPRRPGGQERVFLNLCAGLERIGIAARINDFSYARRNPNVPVGIIGKTHLLYERDWKNPILFGASVASHPLANPDLFDRGNICRILVPGEWMRDMCEPFWGRKVHVWPVGIDTDHWAPADQTVKTVDVILYNKIRWDHARFDRDLVEPIRNSLREKGLSFEEIRYGHYREEDFHRLLQEARTMIFLCEHETQGIAYQQTLSAGVPILAWDRQGAWQDPEFYPDQVRFEPVSSVPYWSDLCGERFGSFSDFEEKLTCFWMAFSSGVYTPREFIVENLSLKASAEEYVGHWKAAFREV